VERARAGALATDDHLLRRALARRAGTAITVSFAKVAEYQQRWAVHFHAAIRLDDAERVAPPVVEVTAELLAQAIRDAAAAVSVRLPVTSRAPARSVGWDEQLDIRCLDTNAGDLTSPSAEAVAAYIAKPATKATEGFGPALDRRLTARDLDHLDVNEHIAELGGTGRLTRPRKDTWTSCCSPQGRPLPCSASAAPKLYELLGAGVIESPTSEPGWR
jgi:hypothetical protein